MAAYEIKLVITQEVRTILESRGIRDEDVSSVVRNAEAMGEKLFCEDKNLAKLVIGGTSFYVEYSAAAGNEFVVRTAYCHRTQMVEA